jgi:hypothetical protein
VIGDPLYAASLFDEAASGYRALPCPARESESLLGLADAHWRAEDADESAVAAIRALEIARNIGATALADLAAQVVNRAEGPTILATVLFTDIVSSTERCRLWATGLGKRCSSAMTSWCAGNSAAGVAMRSTRQATVSSPFSTVRHRAPDAPWPSVTRWLASAWSCAPAFTPVNAKCAEQISSAWQFT